MTRTGLVTRFPASRPEDHTVVAPSPEDIGRAFRGPYTATLGGGRCEASQDGLRFGVGGGELPDGGGVNGRVAQGEAKQSSGRIPPHPEGTPGMDAKIFSFSPVWLTV